MPAQPERIHPMQSDNDNGEPVAVVSGLSEHPELAAVSAVMQRVHKILTEEIPGAAFVCVALLPEDMPGTEKLRQNAYDEATKRGIPEASRDFYHTVLSANLEHADTLGKVTAIAQTAHSVLSHTAHRRMQAAMLAAVPPAGNA